MILPRFSTYRAPSEARRAGGACSSIVVLLLNQSLFLLMTALFPAHTGVDVDSGKLAETECARHGDPPFLRQNAPATLPNQLKR